jgi:hypothetical protein
MSWRTFHIFDQNHHGRIAVRKLDAASVRMRRRRSMTPKFADDYRRGAHECEQIAAIAHEPRARNLLFHIAPGGEPTAPRTHWADAVLSGETEADREIIKKARDAIQRSTDLLAKQRPTNCRLSKTNRNS